MHVIHSDYYNPEVSSALLFLLQGGGFGEPAHRQPHGPEQPLHPSRSREQLLSLHTYRTVPQRRRLGASALGGNSRLWPEALRHWETFFFFVVSDDGTDWSQIETEERLISSLITSITLFWNGAVRATAGGTHPVSRCFSAFFPSLSLFWTVDWVTSELLEVLSTKVPLNNTRYLWLY